MRTLSMAANGPVTRAAGPAAFAFAMRDLAPRIASVLPGVISRGRARDRDGSPLLYLTFDDGPAAGTTHRLLETLARHNAGATFFVLGARAANSPALLREIADAGHLIGNHGWSHVDAWKRVGAVEHLRRGQAWLEDALGRRIADTRPPHGRITPATYNWARNGRRRIVLWDCMPGDFLASVATPELAERLARRARPGSIVVLHDGNAESRAGSVLDAVLPRMRDAGWRFATL